MNKILSQAIRKAVPEYSPKEIPINNEKRPDLFSLSNETELFQNDKGITIKIDRSKDVKLTDFGKATLSDRYLGQNESYQDLFARVASIYADNNLHAQRIYNYISNLWFMPATPILSNGGNERGLPISCFLNEAGDSLYGILNLWSENVWLAAKGGGIGSYWGNLRSIGEKIGRVGKTSGIIPFIKVMDSLTMAISQGSLRRGSAACYLPIDHPEIEEFIEFWRGVPLITVLFMASVMMPMFLPDGTYMDKLVRVIIAITLFEAAYMAEVIRGGLQALPRGQYDAGKSLGMGYWRMHLLIILPQALKITIPGLANTFIALFKDTPLILVVGLLELIGMIDMAKANPYWLGFAIEGYVFAGAVYWIFCFSMSRYSQNLERKYKTDR